MDGSTGDHSDSDSGESWTILEASPNCGEDAPVLPENNATLEQSKTTVNFEKDEDTDGISVISDSDPESSLPCEIYYDKCINEDTHTPESLHTEYISVNQLPSSSVGCHTPIRTEDDFLGVNTGKHKTYVHRRNKRLSTVLNIIMLGSVITAAGVAIGHMWGAKNECLMHTTPSINKVLSNLYKLQEENAYLRNKLKELTLASGINVHQKKGNLDKIPYKQQRCKKVYEEPLNSKNVDKVTKCIDMDNSSTEKILTNNAPEPDYEKEFLSDIDKLKNIYQQNKSWLDDEVARRMKNEELNINKMVRTVKTPLTSIMEEQNQKAQDETTKDNQKLDSNNLINPDINNDVPLIERKITYADSLKADHNPHNIIKREVNIDMEINNNFKKQVMRKKKKESNIIFDVKSEEDVRKDDRYVTPKTKLERKKRDRQKLHKKQKRRNKYEQWEMKGGYLKDYDEFSLTSSQDTDFVLIKPDKNSFSQDFEKKMYINQFSDTDDDLSKFKGEKSKEKASKSNGKDEQMNWLDKRAALRTEARRRMEREMFGEASSNSAGWYFRRMQRREQCRAKGDNSTYRKFSKRSMNFKTKH